MAFPVIEATATSTETAATTSHTITLPAGIVSGDLLIVLIGGQQLFGDIPTGWSRPVYMAHSSDTGCNDIHVLQRTADGTEGSTLSFTSSASRETAHISYRISGWDSIEFASQAEGASTTPDPPSLTPAGGADDYLWLAICGTAGGTLSAGPTNYSNFLNPNTGTGSADAHIASASRSLNATSEDPGGFTNSSSQSWVTVTAAVSPAGETPVSNARTLHTSHLAPASKAETLHSSHLLGGSLGLTLHTYHMAPAGSAVSKTRTLPTHHLSTVANGLTLTAYHMAGVVAPITPSGDVSVRRAFSILVFEAGEDVGGTVDFTVDS